MPGGAVSKRPNSCRIGAANASALVVYSRRVAVFVLLLLFCSVVLGANSCVSCAEPNDAFLWW